jgi:hypothetical protein
MSSDPQSTGAHEADSGAGAAGATQSRGAARALGRGLADVSHLFLQRTAEPRQAGEQPVGRGVASAVTPEGAAARPVVVEPPPPSAAAAAARAELIATLKQSGGALEWNLRVIDTGVPCVPCGEIDLVALDASNQLTIIDVDCSGAEGLLLRGLSHADWCVQNAAILHRLYRELPVDFARPPRLLLVAPRFSPAVTSAIRRFTGLDITCMRCLAVDISGRPGILFERVPVEVW